MNVAPKKVLAGVFAATLTFGGGLLGGVYAAGKDDATTKIAVKQNTKDIKRVETDMKETTKRIEKNLKDVDKKVDKVILLLLEMKK